jgi:phosphoribosyl-dephospho-CoA transferase
MLIKLAMEKTDMEREVSFNIANRGCVMWYRKVRVCSRLRIYSLETVMVNLTVAILIQAGNKRRGSSEPPER